MKKILIISSVFFIAFITACNTNKKKEQPVASFLTAKDVVQFNQLVYKVNVKDSFARYAPGYDIVFLPKEVNGNLAILAKDKTNEQYA